MPQQQFDIWYNNEMVPYDKAKVHVLAHALHYGSAVFEGIRAYKTPKGTCFFRLETHIERLFDSARIYRMKIPYTAAQLEQACKLVVRQSGLEAAYVRPLAFRGLGPLGIVPKAHPTDVIIAAMDWGRYLGDAAFDAGVHAAFSSWARLAPNTIPTHAKASGNYLSSQLIALEARQHGFDEAIVLDTSGYVSEGPGENIFVVRKGILYTPPLFASLLPGITRDAVNILARDLGFEVREENLTRESIYLADELFFTGTAAEITPITRLEHLPVGTGQIGPITQRIREAFFGLFSGQTPDRYHWLSALND